jgi:hypothetical protein
MHCESPVGLDGFVVRTYEGCLVRLAAGMEIGQFESSLALIERRYGRRTAAVLRTAMSRVEPAEPARKEL